MINEPKLVPKEPSEPATGQTTPAAPSNTGTTSATNLPATEEQGGPPKTTGTTHSSNVLRENGGAPSAVPAPYGNHGKTPTSEDPDGLGIDVPMANLIRGLDPNTYHFDFPREFQSPPHFDAILLPPGLSRPPFQQQQLSRWFYDPTQRALSQRPLEFSVTPPKDEQEFFRPDIGTKTSRRLVLEQKRTDQNVRIPWGWDDVSEKWARLQDFINGFPVWPSHVFWGKFDKDAGEVVQVSKERQLFFYKQIEFMSNLKDQYLYSLAKPPKPSSKLRYYDMPSTADRPHLTPYEVSQTNQGCRMPDDDEYIPTDSIPDFSTIFKLPRDQISLTTLDKILQKGFKLGKLKERPPRYTRKQHFDNPAPRMTAAYCKVTRTIPEDVTEAVLAEDSVAADALHATESTSALYTALELSFVATENELTSESEEVNQGMETMTIDTEPSARAALTLSFSATQRSGPSSEISNGHQQENLSMMDNVSSVKTSMSLTSIHPEADPEDVLTKRSDHSARAVLSTLSVSSTQRSSTLSGVPHGEKLSMMDIATAVISSMSTTSVHQEDDQDTVPDTNVVRTPDDLEKPAVIDETIRVQMEERHMAELLDKDIQLKSILARANEFWERHVEKQRNLRENRKAVPEGEPEIMKDIWCHTFENVAWGMNKASAAARSFAQLQIVTHRTNGNYRKYNMWKTVLNVSPLSVPLVQDISFLEKTREKLPNEYKTHETRWFHVVFVFDALETVRSLPEETVTIEDQRNARFQLPQQLTYYITRQEAIRKALDDHTIEAIECSEMEKLFISYYLSSRKEYLALGLKEKRKVHEELSKALRGGPFSPIYTNTSPKDNYLFRTMFDLFKEKVNNDVLTFDSFVLKKELTSRDDSSKKELLFNYIKGIIGTEDASSPQQPAMDDENQLGKYKEFEVQIPQLDDEEAEKIDKAIDQYLISYVARLEKVREMAENVPLDRLRLQQKEKQVTSQYLRSNSSYLELSEEKREELRFKVFYSLHKELDLARQQADMPYTEDEKYQLAKIFKELQNNSSGIIGFDSYYLYLALTDGKTSPSEQANIGCWYYTLVFEDTKRIIDDKKTAAPVAQGIAAKTLPSTSKSRVEHDNVENKKSPE